MLRTYLTKGAVTSIPLVIIAQIFFYVTSRSAVAESALIYIRPLLYISFITCAIGMPVYFWFTDPLKRIPRMVITVWISWGILSLFITLSAFLIYPGLAKDIEGSLFTIITYFFKWYITGSILLSLCSSIVAAVCKWVLPQKVGK